MTNCQPGGGLVAQGSLGGVLTSKSQSCSGGVASGTVFLDWETGGGSTAHLHFSLSLTAGDDIPVTLSGKIISGQFAGDTISGQGTITLQTSTGSPCAAVDGDSGQPVLGGNVDPDGNAGLIYLAG